MAVRICRKLARLVAVRKEELLLAPEVEAHVEAVRRAAAVMRVVVVVVVVAVLWLLTVDACVRATPPAVRLGADVLAAKLERRRVAAKAMLDFVMVRQNK
jgi:hypothetical protein